MVNQKKDENQLNKVASIKEATEDQALDVLDEDSLIEDDGDFFWVLQRVVWGILKGVFLLIAIGFFIWFIWGDSGDIFPSEKEIKKTAKEAEINNFIAVDNDKLSGSLETLTIYEKGNLSMNIDAISMIETAYRLDERQIVASSSILSESILWLKKAKTLGEISPKVLRIESPRIRAKKIEEVLIEADTILKESVQLKKVLQNQNRALLQKKQVLEAQVKDLDEKIFGKISRFDTRGLEELLDTKIKKQKKLVEYSEKGKIRETLIKNIGSFENLLKQKWIPLIRPVQIEAVKR